MNFTADSWPSKLIIHRPFILFILLLYYSPNIATALVCLQDETVLDVRSWVQGRQIRPVKHTKVRKIQLASWNNDHLSKVKAKRRRRRRRKLPQPEMLEGSRERPNNFFFCFLHWFSFLRDNRIPRHRWQAAVARPAIASFGLTDVERRRKKKMQRLLGTTFLSCRNILGQ